MPRDLFLGVPVHRAPAVVEASGLTVNRWIPANSRTLETAFPGVYAGLRAGATADEVLARVDADGAPFAGADAYRAFVTQGLEELAPDA
jgi:hypothetical protein